MAWGGEGARLGAAGRLGLAWVRRILAAHVAMARSRVLVGCPGSLACSNLLHPGTKYMRYPARSSPSHPPDDSQDEPCVPPRFNLRSTIAAAAALPLPPHRDHDHDRPCRTGLELQPASAFFEASCNCNRIRNASRLTDIRWIGECQRSRDPAQIAYPAACHRGLPAAHTFVRIDDPLPAPAGPDVDDCDCDCDRSRCYDEEPHCARGSRSGLSLRPPPIHSFGSPQYAACGVGRQPNQNHRDLPRATTQRNERCPACSTALARPQDERRTDDVEVSGA